MPHPRLAIAMLVAITLAGPTSRAEGPIRGVLVEPAHATPALLGAWKARGANAVVVPLDEATPRGHWADLAGLAEREGLALYPWIEVARNPRMADAHPDWIASIALHHDDWRARFPAAPVAKPGEVLKAWPWVPIGYAPAFDAHRLRIKALLDDLPGRWAGVFLDDLQASPSSCGCGNDQCRWAIDYGAPSTVAKTPGLDAAARLVAEVRARHPGKAVVPVWVTECETIDLPGAEHGTGHCGRVACAATSCWPRYATTWNALTRANDGPIAVGLWPGAFRRGSGWTATGLGLFLQPPNGGDALAPRRAVAVLQGWGAAIADPSALIDSAKRAEGGWVVAIDRVDQSWEPRAIKAPMP